MLKEIILEDRCLAIQNWLKTLDKSMDELLVQEKYEYIHADSKFIKGVIKAIQSDETPPKDPEINLNSPPEEEYEGTETGSYHLLYNGIIILGTILVSTLLARDYLYPFLLEYFRGEGQPPFQGVNNPMGNQMNEPMGNPIQPNGEEVTLYLP